MPQQTLDMMDRHIEVQLIGIDKSFADVAPLLDELAQHAASVRLVRLTPGVAVGGGWFDVAVTIVVTAATVEAVLSMVERVVNVANALRGRRGNLHAPGDLLPIAAAPARHVSRADDVAQERPGRPAESGRQDASRGRLEDPREGRIRVLNSERED